MYEYEASFGYNTNLGGYCKKQMVGFFDYIRDTFSGKRAMTSLAQLIFCYLEKQVRQNYNKLSKHSQNILNVWSLTHIKPIIPRCLYILHQEGAGAEVVSAFELLLAKKNLEYRRQKY